MSTPHRPLQWNLPRLKVCVHMHGRILRYIKCILRTRQIKVIGQKKSRTNAPYKWFKISRGHAFLLESTRVSIHTYCTLFPLINTLLLSVFVGIFFCEAEEPGPCHWPLVYWVVFDSHCCDLSLWPCWNLASSSSRLRPP